MYLWWNLIFDPIHSGHIEIIRRLSEKFDKVVVVPTTIRYYKKNDCMYSFNHRIERVKAEVQTLRNVEISDIEREVNADWRFIDTLKFIRSTYGIDNTYYVAMGSDSFQKFESWANYRDIIDLSGLVVFRRPGYEDNFPSLPHEYISDIDIKLSSTDLRKRLEEVEDVIESDVFETFLMDVGWADKDYLDDTYQAVC